MVTLSLRTEAYKCQNSNKILLSENQECTCGCQPEIGGIRNKDWKDSFKHNPDRLYEIFIPARKLKTYDLISINMKNISNLLKYISNNT